MCKITCNKLQCTVLLCYPAHVIYLQVDRPSTSTMWIPHVKNFSVCLPSTQIGVSGEKVRNDLLSVGRSLIIKPIERQRRSQKFILKKIKKKFKAKILQN